MRRAILDAYSEAAAKPQPGLCCPSGYDTRYLEIIPKQILDRDYGCGDPTPFVRAGDVVLDVGSGSGKLCFILAQIVGSEGRVIGVDANRAMLEQCLEAAPIVSLRLGYRNMTFKRAAIEDLDLDLDALHLWLKSNPVQSADEWLLLQEEEARLRASGTVIADHSVDVIVANCVLNLIEPRDRQPMFDTLARKLKPGGRVVLSDIVREGALPAKAMAGDMDAECIGGAFECDELSDYLSMAGLKEISIVLDPDAWRVIDGATFRSATILATKPGSERGGVKAMAPSKPPSEPKEAHLNAPARQRSPKPCCR